MTYPTEDKEDFYLWHLQKIGVLDNKLKPSHWATACKKERIAVAIIDTGIDTGHPNLNTGKEECSRWSQIDFTPHLYGARYVPPLSSVRRYLDARALPNPLDLTELRKAVRDELGEWSKRLGLDISVLTAVIGSPLGEHLKDAKFHEALVGTPAFSGFAAHGALTPGPTIGEDMLPGETAPGMKRMQQVIDGLGNDDIDDEIKGLWAGLDKKKTINIPCEDPSRYFGAHGTACAGLIGGRPACPEASIPENGTAPTSIDYFGVNPYCDIIPIATPYSHEVLPMIHALIYAVAHGARVIHIPRGLPDYVDRNWKMKDTHFRTRIDRPVGAIKTPNRPSHLSGIGDAVWNAANLTGAEKMAVNGLVKAGRETERDASVTEDQADLYRLMLHSKMFERILKAVSKHEEICVVLSAGNDGWAGRLSYPARIHDSAGEDDNLIVVGAANRRAYDNPVGHPGSWDDFISSYSNGRKAYGKLGTYHALSDDGFALDKDRVAYDQRGRYANDYSYEPHLPSGLHNSYSDWRLLTLDVRGSYGYAAGKRYDPPEYDDGKEVDALYSLFGGTSAASALVAGLISLLLQTGNSKSGVLTSLSAKSPVSL